MNNATGVNKKNDITVIIEKRVMLSSDSCKNIHFIIIAYRDMMFNKKNY